jgi:hypothetical protein
MLVTKLIYFVGMDGDGWDGISATLCRMQFVSIPICMYVHDVTIIARCA